MKWPWWRKNQRPVEEYQRKLDKVITERATQIEAETENLRRLVRERHQGRLSGGARET